MDNQYREIQREYVQQKQEYRKAKKYNRETKSTKSTGEEEWETLLSTRVNHALAFGDLSPPMRAARN
jgi:hypothetical protein